MTQDTRACSHPLKDTLETSAAKHVEEDRTAGQLMLDAAFFLVPAGFTVPYANAWHRSGWDRDHGCRRD